MDYRPTGVCSQNIHIDMDGDIIRHVEFYGGCSGNTQGISRLVEGRKATDVIPLLEGIRCGMKPTSCPDQLAKALKKALQ